MITLLLTLFISLFSICPSNYQVEDHTENVVVLDETLPQHNVIELWGTDSIYLPYGELLQYYLYRSIVDGLYEWSGYVPFDDISVPVSSAQDYIINNVSGCYVNVPNDYSLLNVNNPDNNVLSLNTTYQVSKIRLWSCFYYPNNIDNYIQEFDLGYMIGDVEHWLSFFMVRTLIGDSTSYFSYCGSVRDYYNHAYYPVDEYNVGVYLTSSFPIQSYFRYSGTSATDTYETGYSDGYSQGYDIGKVVGGNAAYGEGYYEGKQDGYAEGLAHADYDSTALTIMQGIIDVGLLPVNVFLMILNFEVFGVNVSGFVSALLTISIVIIIVRFLFGGKNNDK